MNILAERLAGACRAVPDALALDDGEIALSYAALAGEAQAIGRRLAAGGLAPGEPVPVAVSNRVGDVAALLGVWQAGGAAVPIHRDAAPALAAGLFERTAARFHVNARADLPAAPALRAPAVVEGPHGAAPPRRPLLDGAAFVVFTSGSTGEPKGVVIDAARLSAKLDMIGAHTGMQTGARVLLALQLTFSFGQWVTLLTLLRAGSVHMLPRFEARAAIARLIDARIGRAPMVPTMVRALLPHAEAGAGREWSGIVMSGGEVLPAALGRRLRAAWPGAGIGDIYGLTETGTCDFFVAPDDYDAAAGSIGHAGAGIEWRLAGDGELLVRSPWRMAGYLDAPQASEAAFEAGYFRTGDLARVRADGRVELIGRSKEIVVRAGNKLAPLEIEAVFLEHPGVEAALATGLPDARVGEALHLLVVPRAGWALDPAALAGWARGRLDRWKLPDRIHLGDALPLGRTGKADRRALAARLAAGEGAAPLA